MFNLSICTLETEGKMRKTITVVFILLFVSARVFAEAITEVHEPPTDLIGWGAQSVGGAGGRVIKVTNLNANGEGSFRAALEAEGPRIIVFEVGGVIDLEKKQIKVKNPYVTIAGQTAPSPGITIIRGGITFNTHDVIMQHIFFRMGDAGAEIGEGYEPTISW